MSRRLWVELSDVEYAKLEELSATRGRSIAQCIKDFVRTCQPGGTGWRAPGMTEKKTGAQT